MGSYGIGPARIVAAAIEQGADERGIVWPAAIAPWQVHLVSLAKAGEEEREAADRIYEELRETGVEALYDDRDAGPGEKLTDAELLGCPLRLVVGRRGLAEGVVEAGRRAAGAEHACPSTSRRAGRCALLQGVDGYAARRSAAAASAASSASTAAGRHRGRPARASRCGPWTMPNLVGYVRLAAIPLFLYLALDSGRRPLAPPPRSSSG